MCIIGNDELATYFDKITVGELSKVQVKVPMKRASDNVSRGGCAFCLNKIIVNDFWD